MALVRRRAAAPAPAEPEATRGPVRRRVVPAKEQPPSKPKHDAKAYVPPDGEAEGGGSGTDYEAVVARYMGKIKNPITAIRARCIQCCNGQMKEVTLCPCTGCALHPFRMGVNPLHKRRKDRLAREGGNHEESEEENDDGE